MNIIVIGLGSMGKRRIRLLSEIKEMNRADIVVYGADSNITRCEEVRRQYNIETYSSLDIALRNVRFDAAVVSTAPLTHASIIKECLTHNMHVFTEINLVLDGYEDNMSLAEEKEKILFLSSTHMYRKEVEYIKKWAGDDFRGVYHYHIGQYLPEWHPWESYKNYFVANECTNACREIFALELPWIVDVFGEVFNSYSVHSKNSELEIEYDDSYSVVLRHCSGTIGNISVDIITPKAGREFEAWGENKYLEWRGTPESLKTYRKDDGFDNVELYKSYDHSEGYGSFIVEDAYRAELEEFLDVINKERTMRYSFMKDKEILAIIDQIGA